MDSIFVYLNPETASEGSGPLHGLKIAIQPNISASGWPTDAGSNALINFNALEDATLVNRLRHAGALISGLTRMSEFGFGLAGSRAGEAVRQGAARSRRQTALPRKKRRPDSSRGVIST